MIQRRGLAGRGGMSPIGMQNYKIPPAGACAGVAKGEAAEDVAGPVGVEEISQGGADSGEGPEGSRGGGIHPGEASGEGGGTGAVAGREAFAVVGVDPGGAEELASLIAPGADAAEQALEEQGRDAGDNDGDDSRDDTPLAVAAGVELPDENRGEGGADELSVLGEEAAFAFDVALEGEPEGSAKAEFFQRHTDRGGG